MLIVNVEVRRVFTEYGRKQKFKMVVRYGLSGKNEVALASPENLRPDVAYSACFFTRKCLHSLTNIGSSYFDYKNRKYTSNYYDLIANRSIMMAGGLYDDVNTLKCVIDGIKYGATNLDVADDVQIEIVGDEV